MSGIISILTFVGNFNAFDLIYAAQGALAGIEPSSSEAAQSVHDLLGKRAEQLGQIRSVLRTRALLEVWLFIHIPATIALLAALLAHVISVFYYW